MFTLTYLMKDDTEEIEKEYETEKEASKAMNELMDDMVSYAEITNEQGHITLRR